MDIRDPMGFSSVCVLAHHAIANPGAWALDSGTAQRLLPAVRHAGCVARRLALPLSSVVAGAAVLAVAAGAAVLAVAAGAAVLAVAAGAAVLAVAARGGVRGQASPDLRG